MLKKFLFVVLSVTLLVAYESTLGQSHTFTYNYYAEVDIDETTGVLEAPAEMVIEPCIISCFDPIMREVGEEEGLDWRFMSAIAYSESRFIENLKSNQGAMGIMQIRPVVARHFNVPMPASTPLEDRLSIILASYNAGIGHVLDARRLARSEGANPNSWESVRHYLIKKSDPAYYEQDIVQSGRFTGSGQTVNYVNEVMRMYRKYCKLAS